MHALVEVQFKHRTIYRSTGILGACLTDICKSMRVINLNATSKTALRQKEVTAERGIQKAETDFSHICLKHYSMYRVGLWADYMHLNLRPFKNNFRRKLVQPFSFGS